MLILERKLRVFFRVRYFIPGPAEQQPPVAFFITLDTVSTPAAPLLEKEGDVLFFALTLDVHHPFELHGPRLRSGLTANDDPLDT